MRMCNTLLLNIIPGSYTSFMPGYFPYSAGNQTDIYGLQRIVKFCRPRPAVTTAPSLPIMHCRALKPKHDTSRELNSVRLTNIGASWKVTQPSVMQSPPVWGTVKSSELFSGDFKIVELSFINCVVPSSIVLMTGFKETCTCLNCVFNCRFKASEVSATYRRHEGGQCLRLHLQKVHEECHID